MLNKVPAAWFGPAMARTGTARGHLYAALLLAALVFIIVFPWHAVNQRIPIWDGADFVLTAQKILESFDRGFWQGLTALYFERGWRPIIFPALSVPFFMAANGQILMGVGLTQFCAVLLLATYLYLFLSESVSSARALLGTLLIVSAKWVIDFSNVFYAELFWLGASAGVAYHLLAALRRPSLLHVSAAGVWLGLMAALRPIETVTLALIPAVCLVYREWSRRRARGSDIGFFIAQLVLPGVIVWLMIMPEQNKAAVLGVLVLFLIAGAVCARRFLSGSPILVLLLLAEFVALGWHLPSLRGLYLWAYETSFGPMASISDQKFAGLAPWTVFWELMQRYAPQLLAVLLAAAVLGALGLRRSDPDPIRQTSVGTIATALLMIVPMLILLSVSGTSDMRRIMPGMLALDLGLVILAVAPIGVLQRLRLSILFAVMVVQVGSAAANGLNIQTPLFLKAQEYFGFLRQPYTGVDPNRPVLEGIRALGVNSGRMAAYTHCYRDYATCHRLDLPMFEPMALSTLAKEQRLPLQVHFIGDLDFSKPDTLAAQIRSRGFDFVLVDMFDSPSQVNRADPYTMHTEAFIALTRGTLPSGLVNRGCFSTARRPICLIEVSARRSE